MDYLIELMLKSTNLFAFRKKMSLLHIKRAEKNFLPFTFKIKICKKDSVYRTIIALVFFHQDH
jgi:hypothetical protein